MLTNEVKTSMASLYLKCVDANLYHNYSPNIALVTINAKDFSVIATGQAGGTWNKAGIEEMERLHDELDNFLTKQEVYK